MLTVNSSNEYKVALSMYKDSKALFSKLLGEMSNFWEEQGYQNIDIDYTDGYQRIYLKQRDEEQIEEDDMDLFCQRFRLIFVRMSYILDKDTMIGRYSNIIQYYFKGA